MKQVLAIILVAVGFTAVSQNANAWGSNVENYSDSRDMTSSTTNNVYLAEDIGGVFGGSIWGASSCNLSDSCFTLSSEFHMAPNENLFLEDLYAPYGGL